MKNQESSSKRLIVFSRYPRAGDTKTRLIPSLGSRGAAALQKILSERMLAQARRLTLSLKLELEVRLPDQLEAASKWLGPDLTYRLQGSGDLGRRMQRAFTEAFQENKKQVVLVGSDIPELDSKILAKAFELLDKKPMVLGPALDGGYYLLGLARNQPGIIEHDNWRKSRSLLSSAAQKGLDVGLLPGLRDLDTKEDLAYWQRLCKKRAQSTSVIIPTLNEEKNITKTIDLIMAENPLEVIVADGHSEDNTLSLAQKAGALTFSCPRGRGKQMNAAARLALGENLLFLHADTSLPSGWSKELLKLLATPHTVAGAFSFKLDISSPGLWLIEKTVALRCLLASLPYGDQALFLKTDLFRSVGGFKEQPIMEDWDLIKRLKKKGKIKISSLPAVTSARRWQNLGLWRTTLVNYLIPAMYMLGASPDICYRIYYGWQVSQLPRKKNP
jgi:hypothetical protein